MATIKTFWKLIKEHNIEIPPIQRDYAQGRSNSKSTEIRKSFVEQIKSTLDESDGKMHLNFIYGKISGKINATKHKENKEAVKSMLDAVMTYSKNLDLNIEWDFKNNAEKQSSFADTTFAPLDGQQRLTTLFLLHWYLMPDEADNKETLKKFSYKIRPSSKDFCTALVEHKLNLELLEDKLPSQHIQNCPWFFEYWQYDPTVVGMLRMLDEIHLVFKNNDSDINYWKKLTEGNTIVFDFLDLDDYKLTDELYVKMNARGVPLTPFENFKAWLIEYVKNNNINISTFDDNMSWIDLLDTKWTDLFWRYKDADNMLIDEELMRYFRNMMQIFLVQQDWFKPVSSNRNSDKDNNRAKKCRELATTLATSKSSETEEYSYLPNSFYSRKQDIYENIEYNLLSDLDRILKSIHLLGINIDVIEEALVSNSNSSYPITLFNKKTSPFKHFISNDSTYEDKSYFFALLLFLEKSPSNINQDQLRQWMRVARNLISNTTIESIEAFTRSIKGLVSLSMHLLKINEYLISDKADVFGFSMAQIEEENRKSKLIIENIEWENILLKYENHSYFRGQINFLLDITSNGNGVCDIRAFVKYADLMSKIFTDKTKLTNKATAAEHTLFERALLSMPVDEYNDYLFEVDSNYTFGTLSGDKTSWKKTVFTSKKRLKAIKELLDNLKLENLNNDLQNICDSYKDIDWKYELINYPEAIHYCKKRLIRYFDHNNILLLGQSATSHYHAELFSFCLDQDIKEKIKSKDINIIPFKTNKYQSVRSVSHHAHARYKAKIDEVKYEIHLHYDSNNLESKQPFMPHPYELKFFLKEEEVNSEEQYKKDVKEILSETNFVWKGKENTKQKGYWVSAETGDELIDILNVLAKKIRNKE